MQTMITPNRQTAVSKNGPEQKWVSVLLMSAFGRKADMIFCSANVGF